MIQFHQITSADEILALNDYYTLAVQSHEDAAPGEGIASVSMMHVVDGEIINEAVVPIEPDTDDSSVYSEEKVSSGLSRLLLGSDVISEPRDLNSLRAFLDRMGYDGEIGFVPVAKLAAAVFPDMKAGSPDRIAEQLGLEVNEPDPALRAVILLDTLFRICRREMGASVSETDGAGVEETPGSESTGSRHEARKSAEASRKKRVSTKTLRRWSEDIWKTSPWVLAAAAVVILIIVLVLILPGNEESAVDRNEAPVNYLVLSWNETGKYGTRPKVSAGGIDALQFRIPYGVYNVLNNNSIPVELEIVKEGADLAQLRASDAEIETAAELSAGNSGNEEDEEAQRSEYKKITIRPNSSRQITIDEEQYLTLSEDAENLVFFYLSPVPEEPESDTTGQISSMQSVVYAYVKGTEVRFRRAPSLEGQIIDSLNNGQQVQVLAVTGEWTHVQVGDQKGYIFSQYLSSDDPAAVKKPETQTETGDDSVAANAASAGTGAQQSVASAQPETSSSQTQTSDTQAQTSTTTQAQTSTDSQAQASTTPEAQSSTAATTTDAGGDTPSNAIEDSPLAGFTGDSSSESNSAQAESPADDDIVISETGPVGDGSSSQASQTAIEATASTAVSSEDSNPTDIVVPSSEYPTSSQPTAVD